MSAATQSYPAVFSTKGENGLPHSLTILTNDSLLVGANTEHTRGSHRIGKRRHFVESFTFSDWRVSVLFILSAES
jgi:hypothetical protein